MLSNLIFSLNGTVPLFLVMLLGYLLRRYEFINDAFISQANKFVFKVTLPILLYRDLSSVDIRASFDLSFVLFCALTTLVSILVIWPLAKWLIKDKRVVGEFVQGSYRSSAAILGAAFIQNIYGTSGMCGMMIIGAVPIYNIFAVLILLFEAPDRETSVSVRKAVLNSLKGIVTNPIIIGITLGAIGGLIQPPMAVIADKTINLLASLTTPLALIAIGAGFKGRQALAQIRLAGVASLLKLVILPAAFLPLAVYMGFSHQELVAIIVMLGSITTPSSYIMAKNMGHDGTLTASICVLTTLFSAFTLTFWLFLFRSLGYL